MKPFVARSYRSEMKSFSPRRINITRRIRSHKNKKGKNHNQVTTVTRLLKMFQSYLFGNCVPARPDENIGWLWWLVAIICFSQSSTASRTGCPDVFSWSPILYKPVKHKNTNEIPYAGYWIYQGDNKILVTPFQSFASRNLQTSSLLFFRIGRYINTLSCRLPTTFSRWHFLSPLSSFWHLRRLVWVCQFSLNGPFPPFICLLTEAKIYLLWWKSRHVQLGQAKHHGTFKDGQVTQQVWWKMHELTLPSHTQLSTPLILDCPGVYWNKIEEWKNEKKEENEGEEKKKRCYAYNSFLCCRPLLSRSKYWESAGAESVTLECWEITLVRPLSVWLGFLWTRLSLAQVWKHMKTFHLLYSIDFLFNRVCAREELLTFILQSEPIGRLTYAYLFHSFSSRKRKNTHKIEVVD